MTAVCPACDAADLALNVAEVSSAVTLSVPDMKCALCIGTIENALNGVAGVKEARVNLTMKRVNVDTSCPPEQLIEVLSGVGYDAYAFDPQIASGEKYPIVQDLLLRIGVAGFAMMNVMLLSVAVWSGAANATKDLFHLISAAIAVPAALYAGQPFFRQALKALKVGRLNMDVPISLAILLASFMSLFEALNGGSHAYFDAALSLTFFLLVGRVLEQKTRAKARSAARDLAALESHTAQKVTDGGVITVPTSQLDIGDIVLVPSGERVPVDGFLLSHDAFTDKSFLTGESEPVSHHFHSPLQAGEINLGAPFEIQATAVGENTRLHQLAKLVETAENLRNKYTSLADRVAGYYAPVVHLLAAATFLGWWVGAGDPRQALNIAIAVLIITCPCALGLAVPAVSTAAIGQLYRLGFLVKSSTALERLASVDMVVFDKTGTLTTPGFTFDLGDLTEAEKQVAKALSSASSHPVSRALSQHLDGVVSLQLSGVQEHPGKGMSGLWGDLSVSLTKAEISLTLQIGNHIKHLPYTEIERPGAEQLPSALSRMNIKAMVLSGDSKTKTAELAHRIGVRLWDSDVSPEGKHERIQKLSRKGAVTCMIGDGINDAAALRAAHASVAPGTALDAARTAVDVVMITPNLQDLPKLFRLARRAVRLYKQNFGIAFAYNAVAIPFAVAGFATPLMAALAMSTSSIVVLLNATRARYV